MLVVGVGLKEGGVMGGGGEGELVAQQAAAWRLVVQAHYLPLLGSMIFPSYIQTPPHLLINQIKDSFAAQG